MKAIPLISLLLSFICLIESCTVYRSTPVTIEKATSDNTKVKILTKNGITYKLNKIVVKDGQYYGIKYIKGQTITQPLDINNIETIKVKNNRASTFLTVASCVTGVGIIGLIIFASNFGVFDEGDTISLE